MQSNAKNVTDYLAEVPEDRRPALTTLRELCRSEMIGYEEVMMYGMPCYSRDGAGVAFASQKHYIALYIGTDIMNAHRDLLKVKGVSLGKGCIRYSKPEKIDFKVVEMLLKATIESTGEICG
jgi:uncharacterized protein YdhG (YjbR/CyaY superfamily)